MSRSTGRQLVLNQPRGDVRIGVELKEAFKPIPVSDPTRHPWWFRLRCAVDLQLASIAKHLRPALSRLEGSVLDVGAGQAPWRGWLPPGIVYRGVDVENAFEFGMPESIQGISHYDGVTLPFPDSSFDNVICIEVLEHTSEPEVLMSEMARVLRTGGQILLSVPWAARRHHIPYDFHRFTRERLQKLFAASDFVEIIIKERGSDVGVIANKLTILTIRLLRPEAKLRTIPIMALGLGCLPIALVFLVAAHAVEYLGVDTSEDPLGYFVKAVRR